MRFRGQVWVEGRLRWERLTSFTGIVHCLLSKTKI